MNAEMIVENILDGYLECALWSSTDDDGDPIDDNHMIGDVVDSSVEELANQVRDFLDLVEEAGIPWRDGWKPSQLGHDFWLTRNGHGAGFWDRYYNCPLAEVGDQLTKIAHTFGEATLYVGDDGFLHLA